MRWGYPRGLRGVVYRGPAIKRQAGAERVGSCVDGRRVSGVLVATTAQRLAALEERLKQQSEMLERLLSRGGGLAAAGPAAGGSGTGGAATSAWQPGSHCN